MFGVVLLGVRASWYLLHSNPRLFLSSSSALGVDRLKEAASRASISNVYGDQLSDDLRDRQLLERFIGSCDESPREAVFGGCAMGTEFPMFWL
jgi:hypothetical protein